MISKNGKYYNSWLNRVIDVSITNNEKYLSSVNRFLKSVRSQERKNQKSSVIDSYFQRELDFTDQEVHSAINRFYKQNKNESISPAGFCEAQYFNESDEIESNPCPPWLEILSVVEPANFDNYSYKGFSPYNGINEPLWVSVTKVILGFIFPPFYDVQYSRNPELHYLLRDFEFETQERILVELLVRKAIKALKNEFYSAFKFLNLLSIQTHLKEVLYEYLNNVFSLKEEVVLKARCIIDFITTLKFFNNEERRNIRYIPITYRT